MMTTSHQRSNFGHWKSLKAWLEESSPSHTEPCATIVLKAILASPATLAELRIEITSFVRLTYTLLPYSLLRFELRSTEKDGSEGCQNHVTTLLLLRKRLFIFISSIMEDYPGRRNDDCPEFWINGYGQIIEATYPGICDRAPQSIVNRDSDMAVDKLELLGETYIKSLEDQISPKNGSGALCDFVSFRSLWSERNNALNESASLESMWKSLFCQDWPTSPGSVCANGHRGLDTR
ncbi:hypothetical protein HBI82_026600 [Parastagonospora nodorum]|nr:hypothetical protein HBI11_012920 [Parastagonospora nodorum]KAH5733280.1 hypothetical protein HBI20_034340 [Parastagonospora nodorum]KAH6035796.1 hypothetical protein HBI82_026600 [Parastagonospora nodorum]